MNKIETMAITVKTMEAYILTNKDYLPADEVAQLNEALGNLYEEQRLWLRTVMLLSVDEEPVLVDITEFYDQQIAYGNDVDPDILQTVANLVYPDAAYIMGYASPIDYEYWAGQLIGSFKDDENKRYKFLTAISSWVNVNK